MKPLNAFELLGATLTIAGSFLPWERSGGFIDYVTNGVWIDFADFKHWVTGIHEFPVYDYGGMLVILLTSAIILFTIQPKFIEYPILWRLITSTVLIASLLFFVGRWLFHLYEHGSTIEQPALMIGLICVVFGSAILLWKAITTYRQPKRRG